MVMAKEETREAEVDTVGGRRDGDPRSIIMTELVVALDGLKSFKLLINLRSVGVTWFKIGPLTLTDRSAHSIQDFSTLVNLFYDAKLADHGSYVCSELAKRLGANGYAALSTSTNEATEAALHGAEGTSLKVWKHVAPTSQESSPHSVYARITTAINQGAHGVILGAWHLQSLDIRPEAIGAQLDFVCPAVRLGKKARPDGGHITTSEPKWCVERGVTHAVVGRPIWQSADSVAAAKRYLEALR